MENLFPQTQAVLFDFDCTLVDSSDLICQCFNSVLIRFGFEPMEPASIRAMIGQPLREMFARQCLDVSLDDLVSGYKEAFASNSPNGSHLLPGADEVIPELARTKSLGIVTTRTAAGALLILRGFELNRFFSTIVGIENVKRTKPDPEPVQLALRQMGVLTTRAVLVGDTVQDMAAAIACGVGAIGITTGPHDRDELLSAGAETVLSELRQLPRLFQGNSSTV